MAKRKPFFDAYTSPHVIKHCYRFWTGLLLFIRMISTIWFAITSKNNEYKQYGVTLTVICILILSIIVFLGGIYNQLWLNILNASFYTNLTILSFFSFYSATKQPKFSGLGNNTQFTATYTLLVIDNDFNGERHLDEDYNWERELDVQDRELNSEELDDHVPIPDSREESNDPRSSGDTN